MDRQDAQDNDDVSCISCPSDVNNGVYGRRIHVAKTNKFMAQLKLIKSPDTLRKDRVPPGQHITKNFPVLHHGDVPVIDLNKWNFRITGLVRKERTLSFSEFTSLPVTQVLSDIHCVTTWTKLDNLWEGVSTGDIKDLVQILPSAKYAIVHAAGGFTTNLPMEDFFAEDVLFAMKYNGELLEPEHGYPVRLIVPRLYFWKSAKWAEGVEFTEEDRPGFWEQRGYHMHGDPWKEERRMITD